MVFIIITLVVALITGIVTTFMNELVLGGLYDMVFHADEMMTQCTGVNFFTTVSDMAFSLALSLMVLKFLKKGFGVLLVCLRQPQRPVSCVNFLCRQAAERQEIHSSRRSESHKWCAEQ